MRAPSPAPPGPLFQLLPPLSILLLGIAFYFLQQSVLALLDPLLPLVHLTVALGVGVGLIGAPLLFVRRYGGSARRTLRLYALPADQILLLGLLAVCLLLPVWLLGELNARLVSMPAHFEEFLTEMVPNTPVEWGLAVLSIAVLVPVGEEIVFRGLLHQAARIALGPRWALVLAALLFAAMHLEPWFLAGLVLLALALGGVFEATGSLVAPIILHMVYNGVVLAILAFGPEGDLPGWATGGVTGVLLALLSPVGAWAAFRRLRPAAGWSTLETEEPTSSKGRWSAPD